MALAAFLFVHVSAWQVLAARFKSALGLLVAACLGYAATCVFVRHAMHIPLMAHAPVSLAVFLFLGVTYFHFYFGLDRSVSVRTLGVLCRAGDGRLAPAELDAFYPQEEMIQRRLRIMLENGWLTERDGVYRCTRKARMVSRLARLGTRLYRVDVSG